MHHREGLHHDWSHDQFPKDLTGANRIPVKCISPACQDRLQLANRPRSVEMPEPGGVLDQRDLSIQACPLLFWLLNLVDQGADRFAATLRNRCHQASDFAIKVGVVPDYWNSSFQLIFWTTCIKLPASDNPLLAYQDAAL